MLLFSRKKPSKPPTMTIYYLLESLCASTDHRKNIEKRRNTMRNETCAECGRVLLEEEATEFEGRVYCPECLDSLTTFCR
jgi:predicted RNA-binding Zn-ribbon protein involved in translation (DUF1610 family)